MATTRKTTGVMLGASALVLLVWDVFVAYNDTPGDTVSEILRDLSHDFYSLPFILMVVMGHLFWNERREDRKPRFERLRTFWLCVALPSALVIGRDVLNLISPVPRVEHANLFMAALGFAVGATYWPQLNAVEDEDTSA